MKTEALHLKLNEIQRKIKVPKSKHNDFGNYNYRSCEDILDAVSPFLEDTSFVVTISDKIILIGDRYYVEATASIGDYEGSISTTAYAREAETKKGMDEAQITGSASSYARKYAAQGLFKIDDGNDPDSTNKHMPNNSSDPKDQETKCPKCGKPGREDKKQKGHYYCWTKKGGCGETWSHAAASKNFYDAFKEAAAKEGQSEEKLKIYLKSLGYDKPSSIPKDQYDHILAAIEAGQIGRFDPNEDIPF